MKYAAIALVLGWTETPELTEGLFLQPEEATKIDQELTAASAAKQAAGELVTANATIQDRDTAIADLKTAAQASADTITQRDQRISELQAEVAELGKGSSGTGTVITAKEDDVTSEKPVTTGLPRYDSPDHPANREADKYTKKKA
jgi:hypothetical protein